jgi:hypothetical protein
MIKIVQRVSASSEHAREDKVGSSGDSFLGWTGTQIPTEYGRDVLFHGRTTSSIGSNVSAKVGRFCDRPWVSQVC